MPVFDVEGMGLKLNLFPELFLRLESFGEGK